MKISLTTAFFLLFAAAPIIAAPKAAPKPSAPGAVPLFERAARVYREAPTLALDYRVTCDAPALQVEESGRIRWKGPKLYAQDFQYACGHGHIAADDKQVYFTDVDGKAGRYAWGGFFGFWTSLPWQPPGHLMALLRGQTLVAGGALRRLPSQQIEGVWCDGAALDLGAGRDKFRFWFARSDGTLRRESWQVVLPDSGKTVWVQTRYSAIQLNAPLAPADFITPAEAAAPLVDPDAASDAPGDAGHDGGGLSTG